MSPLPFPSLPAVPEGVGFELAPPGSLDTCRAALTERSGGVSPVPYRSLNLGRSTADAPERVRANESRVIRALDLADSVARLRLEHGRTVLTVDSPGLHGPADAILTARPDLILWLTVADCFPLAVAAGAVRVLGHCGWRGVAAGLAEEILAQSARASGVPPSRQRAWIGPGIGPCCYPVGPEVARRFPESVRAGDPPDGIRLDLRSEIRRRLLVSGLPPESIAVSASCTSCDRDRFFSYRRDGPASGRMAALFWMEAPPAEASTPGAADHAARTGSGEPERRPSRSSR